MISANRPTFIEALRPDDETTPPLKTWSFSGLQLYEDCPKRSYLQRVKKIPQPSGPAADRGSKIHDMAEHYVDGTITDDKIPKELSKFEVEFRVLRQGYIDNPNIIQLEQEWGYDKDWAAGDWKMRGLWLRSKLDVYIQESQTNAIIIDHKTGQKFGNELKHNAQLMLYAICAFMKFPALEHVVAKLWYLDKGETMEQSYTRSQAMTLFPRWNTRALAMTSAVNFPATPNKSSCKWCGYGKPNEDDVIVCPYVHTEL